MGERGRRFWKDKDSGGEERGEESPEGGNATRCK